MTAALLIHNGGRIALVDLPFVPKVWRVPKRIVNPSPYGFDSLVPVEFRLTSDSADSPIYEEITA